MAKILLDIEMADIVYRAVHDEDVIDQPKAYKAFLEDLAALICNHFGATAGKVRKPEKDIGWTCAFHLNELVPDNGGEFSKYDPDVQWTNGEEV